MSERIIPGSMQTVYDTWHFAPAVRTGGLIFLSGVIGTEADGTVSDDLETQFHSVFASIETTLAEAGCTLSDIVEMTSYHVSLAETFSAFSAVKDARMSEPHPAWTAVGVESLLLPGAMVEVKAVAQTPEPQS
jgi:enamine deaminase RidA (YjgF/YER057c/UK114 family)